MQPRQVSIIDAFSAAFERMKVMLFQPFSLEKWLTVGFTAWLAGAGGGGGGNFGSGFNFPGGGDFSPDDWDDAEDVGDAVESLDAPSIIEAIVDWIAAHPGWTFLIGGGCLLLVAFILLIVWLQSRGKFMFLDNVIHDRAEVVAPWKRFRRLGNSLFLFQLALGVVVTLGFVLIGGLVALTLVGSERPFETPLGCVAIAIGALLSIVLMLVVSFVYYFLNGFVVPLMHRYDLKTMEAWNRFGPLLRSHFWSLVLSGLFLAVVAMGVGIGLFLVGILTCCIGLILLALPYVGTVLILPVVTTYRLYTVNLLDQIDPGYFPAPAIAAPAAPAP